MGSVCIASNTPIIRQNPHPDGKPFETESPKNLKISEIPNEYNQHLRSFFQTNPLVTNGFPQRHPKNLKIALKTNA